MRGLLLLVVFALSTMCASAYAQDKESFVAPSVSAVETANPPKLDGILDDGCWQTLDKSSGFRDTDHSRDATNPTDVMLCYDQTNLYIAFVCYDPQPSLIQAQQKQRNCGLGSDDSVSILIDTLHNHLDNYEFAVNPIGTQNESIPFASAENITWRGDWHAASSINDKGWCTEIAIPFRTLRYPAKGDTFGIAFTRTVPRIAEGNVWPDVGANWDMKRFADLTQIKLPKQRGWPVLMPYTVASTQPGDSMSSIGLDFKEEFANNIIALATYNPDFTDIQDSVSSIAFSHTERYQSDYRPFFQEGSSLFPDRAAFYSRRIQDMDMGVKGFGKVGSHAFAFMGASKPGEENHFASTYACDFGQNAGFASFFTGSMVQDEFKQNPLEPGTSLCVSPGAFKRWRDDTSTTTLSCRQYIAINSGIPFADPANPNQLVVGQRATHLNANLSRSTTPRHLGYSLNYSKTDSDYYVRDSYVPTTGVYGASGSLNYYDQPTKGPLEYWSASVGKGRAWNQGPGGVHDEGLSADFSCSTRSEWSYGTSFYTGTWLGARDATVSVYTNWLTRHLYQGGSFSCTFGKQSSENYFYYSIGQSLRISDRLRIYGDFEQNRWGGDEQSQFSVSGNYQITPERSIGLWAVGRDSEINLCLTYSQTVRSGSDIYLILGSPNANSTQSRVALKVVTPMAW